jgi:hypothetical protein
MCQQFPSALETEGKDHMGEASKQVSTSSNTICTANSPTGDPLEIHDSSTDGESETRTESDSDFDGRLVQKRTSSMTAKSNDVAEPEQVAEVADDMQEWEIRDIISKEDVDGVPHYLVEWKPTLVPKYELKKAKGLVDKFEARLRAQGRQRGGKRRGRLLPSKSGHKAAMGSTGER